MSPGLRAAYIRSVQGGAPIDYALTQTNGKGLGRNPAQRFDVEIGADGARLKLWRGGSKAVEPRLSMRLRGIRRSDWRHDIALDGSATPVASNHWRLDHEGGVEEWYVNGPLGLEQGFDLREAPLSANPDAVLALEVEVSGDITPVATPDRTSVALRAGDGETVLRYSDLYAEDASGRMLESWMAVEGGAIVLYIDDLEARYPVTVDPLVFAEVKKLMASDAADFDGLGASVALSGDTALIGARGNAAAYVFERNLGGADNWGESKKITTADSTRLDHFGEGVALAGDTAVVGAPYQGDAVVRRGAAFVFERNLGGANNWGQRKKLTASDAQDFDWFGSSVSISADTVLIGMYEDSTGPYRGAAYVFERSLGGADNWGERKKILPSDPTFFDLFGRAVAISGDIAIVGAANKTFQTGFVYVFERNLGGADNWGERKKTTGSDSDSGDFFGISVALSGDTALVGAHFQGGGSTPPGAAYLFERNLGGADNWGERKKLIASDFQPSDEFGVSVALFGDNALVGAEQEGGAAGTGANRGAAYVFERNLGGANSWGQSRKLSSSDTSNQDFFGTSVAIGVDAALVGAPNQDGLGTNRGAAYAFAIRDLPANGTACLVGSECATGFCVDGVCCDTHCGQGSTTDCQACSVSAGGAANGTCGPRASGACSDGVFCNGTETCSAGTCGGSTGDPCTANVGDADTDCSESCFEPTDSCTANDPNGSACSDSLYCTGTESCNAGVCASSGNPCAANLGDADTDCSESCDEPTDSCTANDMNGSACTDGLYCTGVDTCTGGVCTSPGDPCASMVGDADADCSESCDETLNSCTANDPDSSSCRDGLFCTGTEMCTGGVCGSPTGNPCFANVGDADSDCSESCNEAGDNCTANDPNGSACDDGLYCTLTQSCTSGLCVGSGNPCSGNVGDADTDCSESCSEPTDDCTANDSNGSACNDGLYCTGTETCTGGVCGNATGNPCAASVGDADTDCSESCDETADSCTATDPDGSVCSDGSFCNGSEFCTAGTCGGPSGDPCAANLGDADSDCSEACNEASNSCTANDADASFCTDGLYCTGTETCTGGVCGNATGDPCAGNLGDADADCSESCNESTDSCIANDAAGSACTDGLYCTGTETCTGGGTCGNATGDPCAANVGDADADCSESCDESLDACTGNDPNVSACSDGLFCTALDTCNGGTCVGTGDPCAANVGDADADCSESCDESADACTGSDPDTSACSDGLFCTGVDACMGGACTSASDPCAANLGGADTDCSESCEEASDACTANDADGAACAGDGLFCNGAESCTAGICGASGDPCAANLGDADTDCSESCDEANDACTASDPDASACSDGLFCTGAEACSGGVCVSGGDPCATNVGDADTDCSESCDETADACAANDPNGSLCDDGFFCTGTESCQAGACASTGDPCAPNLADADTNCAESCDEASDSCTADDPDGASCFDGNLCNESSCQSGACSPVPVTCTPADACNEAGACNPATGQCETAAKADGTVCTTEPGDQGTCLAGECLPESNTSGGTVRGVGCSCGTTSSQQAGLWLFTAGLALLRGRKKGRAVGPPGRDRASRLAHQ